DTLEAATQHLQAFQPGEIRTAVMHHKAVTRFEADYSAGKIIKWRWLIYPWAVNEDVSDFLKRLTPAPGSLEDAQIRLAQRFNIKISLKRLRGIYASINR
ncbi:MAG: phosphoribosyltransferase, partial [Gammaproteobacteria bacterium]|nr:phosphoribosyltransferase [Gammaproteobacteria bacterium]